MAISPPGDLVLDVMRAADPQRARLAEARLQNIAASTKGVIGGAKAGGADDVASGQWRRAMDRVASSALGGHGPLRLGKAPDVRQLNADGSLLGNDDARLASSATSAGGKAGQAAASARLRQAYAGLEGVLLTSMLDGMMGTGRTSIFGGGLAGGYWKSMLAQTIAAQVAQGGGLGVAAALSSAGMTRRG